LMGTKIKISFWEETSDRELSGLINSIPLIISILLTCFLYQVSPNLAFTGFALIFLSGISIFFIRIYNNATLEVTSEGIIVHKSKKLSKINWEGIKKLGFKKVEDDLILSPIVMSVETDQTNFDFILDKHFAMTPGRKHKLIMESIRKNFKNSDRVLDTNLK